MVFYPKETDRILKAPGKGLVMYTVYENGPDDVYKGYEKEYEKCLKVASCFNIKATWRELQPNKEDEYDFSRVERYLKLAEKYDKRIIFGFATTASTGPRVTNPPQSLVPQWVYDAGAKYRDITCANYQLEGGDIHRIPDYTDPIFREKLEKLVAEVARRYDGNPYFECFINFTNGNWGEWHHFDINGLPVVYENLYVDADGKKLDVDFFRYFVELFPRFFKKSRIMMPSNIFYKNEYPEEWVRLGVDKYGYGIKREGLVSIPDCTWGMRYASGKGYTFGEWQTQYTQYRSEERWDDKLIDRQIIDGRLSHYSLGYYGGGMLIYMREKENQVNYWANHLGYYYTIGSCSLPDDYKKAGKHNIEIEIINDGVGPICDENTITLTFEEKGEILYKTEIKDSPLKKIESGQTVKLSADYVIEKDCEELNVYLSAENGRKQSIPFANEVKSEYGYLINYTKDIFVRFEHRSPDMAGITEYMGLTFEGDFRTLLRRDSYKKCLYYRNYLNSYTGYITFPEKKIMKSISLYGIGTVKIKTESEETVTFELSRDEKEYRTDFKLPSGRAEITFSSPEFVWSIMITSITYGE